MPAVSKPPLSDADYAKINKALAALEAVRMETQRAMEAGFPCAEQDAECQAWLQRFQQIKKVYFPERP